METLGKTEQIHENEWLQDQRAVKGAVARLFQPFRDDIP